MKKLVNEHGELVLARTPAMQTTLTWAYQDMVRIAFINGVDGAYENAISDQLKKLYLHKRSRPWINELLVETGVDVNTFPGEAFTKAGTLIFKSKIIKNEYNNDSRNL